MTSGPSAPPAFVAIDLGAESGRVMLGELHEDTLRLTEIHRFPNGPVHLAEGLRWDVPRLWLEICAGLGHAAEAAEGRIQSVAVDSWGVDFALLGRDGSLLGLPAHYRDDRTLEMVEEALWFVPANRLFATTGIQPMRINTLFQLLSLARSNSPQLALADRLVMIPDLFGLWLSGRQATEFSIATTSQCLDIRGRRWADSMLEALAIPARIFGDIVPAGTVLGPLVDPVAATPGLASALVVATAAHDTASAVAAVPHAGPDVAWISSGTWSIMGFGSNEPVLSELAMRNGIGNEGAADGGYLVGKTMPGLWLVQECRREWAKDGAAISYGTIARMASEAAPLVSFVDPADESLAEPGEMSPRIRALCRKTGQPEPLSRGAVLRCVFESLALQYRRALDQLEASSGRHFTVVHIVGGGSRNDLLCQMTADALNRPCFAGPVEATAIGNILVQAAALGLVRSLDDGREIVRRSFDIRTFEPRSPAAWDEPYRRYLELTDGH